MSEESDSEMKEIKISDVKEKIIKKQKEEELLKKKRGRKINKKKRKNKKIDLLSKYKEQIENKIDENLLNNENLLVQKEKSKGENNKIKKNIIYKKNSVLIKINNLNQKEEFQDIKEDLLNFKKNSLFGDSIQRTKNFLNKI